MDTLIYRDAKYIGGCLGPGEDGKTTKRCEGIFLGYEIYCILTGGIYAFALVLACICQNFPKCIIRFILNVKKSKLKC